MNARHAFSIAALAALAGSLIAATPCASAPANTSPVTYTLVTPPSAYETGCQGPCECAVLTQPTYGSLTLVYQRSDPLYDYYAVDGYIASFNNGPGAVSITGSGQFRIGGEFALTEQLTLDLSVWGAPPVHFDSGVKTAGSVAFPKIDLSCAVHGFACVDTVVVVDATPVDVAGVPPGGPAVRIESAQPNPFTSQARIAFTLAQDAPVGLVVVDLAGRPVRVLAAGQAFAAGPQTLTWDGRRDDGSVAPSGVYWARLRVPGGMARLRLVKLR